MVLRGLGTGRVTAALTFCTAMLFLGISLVPFVRPDLIENAFSISATRPVFRPNSSDSNALPRASSADAYSASVLSSPSGLANSGPVVGAAVTGGWWRDGSADTVSGPEASTVSMASELAIDLQARTGIRPREAIGERLWRQPELPPLAQENTIPSVMRAAPRIAPPAISIRLGVQVPAEIRRWEQIILRASQKYEIDPNLIAALMQTESAGRPNALSSMNAVGLMQVMGGSFEPEVNVDQGVYIFAGHLRRYGAIDLALAAYNAGPGAVANYGGIPPYEETQRHVTLTIASYKKFRDT